MKRASLGRYAPDALAFSAFFLVMQFAGCGGAQTPIGAPGAMPLTPAIAPDRSIEHAIEPASFSYRVLYGFPGGSNSGAYPEAGLTNVSGTLYGTTTYGGSGCGGSGCGTVYSVTTSGAQKLLHSFVSDPDGAYPSAGLVNVDNTLYGTTYFGGSGCGGSGCGTVYSISRSDVETVLHRFTNNPDGAFPSANLIDVKGTLYGTTTAGGKYDRGTVFSITTAGTERVLYSFGSGSDGELPYASLIDVKGTLYGTTEDGGSSKDGTVFSISTSGKEKVLYSFRGGSDGELPVAALVKLNGTLYGTTSEGGAYFSYPYDLGGTVFSVTTAGTEHVLHSFGNGSDGTLPYAGLVNVSGKLYGTTPTGGTHAYGTIFSVSTAGRERVVHNFAGGSNDGANPLAGLTDLNGMLYGTTQNGPGHDVGAVFSL